MGEAANLGRRSSFGEVFFGLPGDVLFFRRRLFGGRGGFEGFEDLLDSSLTVFLDNLVESSLTVFFFSDTSTLLLSVSSEFPTDSVLFGRAFFLFVVGDLAKLDRTA